MNLIHEQTSVVMAVDRFYLVQNKGAGNSFTGDNCTASGHFCKIKLPIPFLFEMLWCFDGNSSSG